jgi:hypothetical protein
VSVWMLHKSDISVFNAVYWCLLILLRGLFPVCGWKIVQNHFLCRVGSIDGGQHNFVWWVRWYNIEFIASKQTRSMLRLYADYDLHCVECNECLRNVIQFLHVQNFIGWSLDIFINTAQWVMVPASAEKTIHPFFNCDFVSLLFFCICCSIPT